MPDHRPPTTIVPRRETSLTPKQERFVHEYLVDLDRRRAIRAAGYEVADDAGADSAASRLLSNPKVYAYFVDQRALIAAEYRMDAIKWVAYLRLVVVEAISERDWTGAVSALREIGRHLGCYEVDNSQKRSTPEDVARYKLELEAIGLDFTRVNAPAHLKLPVVRQVIVENSSPNTQNGDTK